MPNDGILKNQEQSGYWGGTSMATGLLKYHLPFPSDREQFAVPNGDKL